MNRLTLGDATPLDHSISGGDLTAILPHITFPALQHIRLRTNEIEPTVLSEFLLRHPGVQYISYRPYGQFPATPLISPVTALPGLVTISATNAADIFPLLDCLDLSPRLSSIKFCYDRSSEAKTIELKAALRRLALRTTEIRLELFFHDKQDHPLDDEEIEIGRSLGSVYCVYVEGAVLHARHIWPWLALLPALRRVELGHPPGFLGLADWDLSLGRLVDETAAVLLGVVEVVLDTSSRIWLD